MTLPAVAALRARPLPRVSGGMVDMALGAFFFSLMSLFVKLVGQGVPTMQVVLVRGLLTLAFTWILIRRLPVHPLGNRRVGLFFRGFLGFAALSCFYYAVVHLPLAEATVLQYMNPVWAAFLAAAVLAERIGRREVALVVVALGGVVLIARPTFLFGGPSPPLDMFAVSLGLLGAALSGAAYVGVRELSRTEHPLVIVLYFPLVTVPASLPFAVMNLVWPTPREWLLLLGVGITAQVGQIYITRGLRREPAGRATAMGYLQVVFATLWGLLFFAEFPDRWAIAGSLTILGCTLALALGGPGSGAAEANGADPPRVAARSDDRIGGGG
jgi:drug/metabolite transporter (DMT)-like permease